MSIFFPLPLAPVLFYLKGFGISKGEGKKNKRLELAYYLT